MSVVVSKRISASFRPPARFYELDVPYVGQINFDVFGKLTWRSFSLHIHKDGTGVDAFCGPVHIEFSYMPETRAKRSTVAAFAMAALALAGWTEGHLWHLPFRG